MNTDRLRILLRACYTLAMEAHRITNFEPEKRDRYYLLSNRAILTLAAEKHLRKVCIGRVLEQGRGYYFDVWEANGLPFSLRTPRPPLFFFWKIRSRFMPHVTEQGDFVPMSVEDAIGNLTAYLQGKRSVTVYRWRCIYCASRDHSYKNCPRNTPEFRRHRAAIKAVIDAKESPFRPHGTFDEEVTRMQNQFAKRDARAAKQREKQQQRDARAASKHALKAQRDAADATTRTASEEQHGYRSRDFDNERSEQ
jgi:hypothetical protein